jgi:adenine-specific DNA-methyltransferase
MIIHPIPEKKDDVLIFNGDVEKYLDSKATDEPFLKLIVSSPPYNIGKEYEEKMSLKDYLIWQSQIIKKMVPLLVDGGSICWQVGNHVKDGEITPLDIVFHPIFESLGLKLRNRIVWKFGHGLHAKKRFSGRYEVVMWYTKGDDYTFNLDAVRIPQKYPGKKHYKGPKVGQYSGNPLGKNPEDVWEIPNVKSQHIEKTSHPCQYPVGLIEPLILALTDPEDIVFDPFAGVCTTGVAAVIHNRKFIGTEIDMGSHNSLGKKDMKGILKKEGLMVSGNKSDLRKRLEDANLVRKSYAKIGSERISNIYKGNKNYRPWGKMLHEASKSKLSETPKEMIEARNAVEILLNVDKNRD